MRAVEIARKLAALGQRADAVQAYILSSQTDAEPAEHLEAAAYILQNGGDYKIAYTIFLELYSQGFFRGDILPLMTKVFYEPNVKLLKNRYDRNCRLLSKYPYLFRKDFPAFETLPLRFFPYDDHNGYIPFDVRAGEFGEFVNVRDAVVSRNFFKDLEKPVFASDVFSQYELEYLNDNVRKSEWVARENHIYLHYTDWDVFCSWLQVLNLRNLLEDQKFVFLIGEEAQLYPIDFQERFGIDYSQYTVRPVGVREISRLIWHTQLSSHNGGDFFNEVFDSHPNLLCLPSVMMSNVEEAVKNLREALARIESLAQAQEVFKCWNQPKIVEELYRMSAPTDKDALVALYLCDPPVSQNLDPNARIAPAVFFQPHFSNIVYQLRTNNSGDTVLEAENYERIQKSAIFRNFKYVKTFTPMRRPTTSHGATVKFMYASAKESQKHWKENPKEKMTVVTDAISERIFNRSFMIDPEDRLYHDSILVRFEDGKLNPTATLRALAAFLDLPYDECMKQCTEGGRPVRVTDDGYAPGFSPTQVYKTYDEFVNDSERYFIEYFLRDAYQYYGYDFQWYDGQPVDEEKARDLISQFTTANHYIYETWKYVVDEAEVSLGGKQLEGEIAKAVQEKFLEEYMDAFERNRIENTEVLLKGLRFVNKNGQPLHMMPKLELDPALLENPIYH